MSADDQFLQLSDTDAINLRNVTHIISAAGKVVFEMVGGGVPIARQVDELSENAKAKLKAVCGIDLSVPLGAPPMGLNPVKIGGGSRRATGAKGNT